MWGTLTSTLANHDTSEQGHQVRGEEHQGSQAEDVHDKPGTCGSVAPVVEGRKPDEPLFLSPEGFRLHPENLVKRKLKPVLQKFGVYVKGTACHGFRHGAATRLDELGTPMATRLKRLGHADPDTTMLYTHTVDDNDRKVSAEFGRVLSQAFTQNDVAKGIEEEFLFGTA